MNKLPSAINQDIVVQQVGKELLIYNLVTNKAYNLNETSTIVFQSCDGKTSFNDLKRKHGFTDDLVYLTLDILAKENLIAEPYQSKFAGVSRREVIRKVGLASMVTLPIVVGIVAPTAANAASETCIPNAPACILNGNALMVTQQPTTAVCFAFCDNRCCSCRSSVSFSVDAMICECQTCF